MDISNAQMGETINVYSRYANIPNHIWDQSEGQWVPYEAE